jgi:hypothetical protein
LDLVHDLIPRASLQIDLGASLKDAITSAAPAFLVKLGLDLLYQTEQLVLFLIGLLPQIIAVVGDQLWCCRGLPKGTSVVPDLLLFLSHFKRVDSVQTFDKNSLRLPWDLHTILKEGYCATWRMPWSVGQEIQPQTLVVHLQCSRMGVKFVGHAVCRISCSYLQQRGGRRNRSSYAQSCGCLSTALVLMHDWGGGHRLPPTPGNTTDQIAADMHQQPGDDWIKGRLEAQEYLHFMRLGVVRTHVNGISDM